MPPAATPPVNNAPTPNPPGYYPPGIQPPPAPEQPPAWATQLITGMGELKQNYEELAQRFDEGIDPNDPGNAGGGQPPAPATPPPAGAPDPNNPYADWKPKDWADVPKTAQEIARSVVQSELEARDQATAAANNQAAQARQEADRNLDQKVRELETQGVIPKIANASDPNDPGRVAQRELYGRALYEQTDDLVRVANDLKFHHEKGMTWDPQNNRWLETNRPPAGMYAPVGSSGVGNMPGQSGATKPTYAEIHSARNLGELARRAGMGG